mmetsp:Transcript_18473/g.38705  ORF Transcript_18473/g.38705 Transcript_18473/m.38705 type:complete len:468 (-) Transcript_18473:1557-2960(-)|eukprot:CAMPEP_0184679506 /NCGR_PEP_ID=MMETSP0312-20130426/2349_1 /TAXON_ID=31354 /ORGANISM="Compsopogon coeruleus, Strain SAG 36.94" /LENGTH=467 /DNA_ID=CAMNT_0027128999 /DNA_START=459 /DNA_END=1862 /DNA_ORIENTATION=+
MTIPEEDGTSRAGAPETGLIKSAEAGVSRRILPVLVTGAFLSYLDRTNVSFAALTMNDDLGLSHEQYGTGAGMLFIAYAACGIPACLLVKRAGAPTGFGILLILWSLCSASTALVTQVWQFYLARILVGAAESGYFPSVLYYLSLWFSEEDVGSRYAIVLVGTTISGIVGGPIAGAIMTLLEGVFGVPGWRWLFVAEALPAMLLGIFCLRYLDRGPETSRFLSFPEREAICARQAQELARRSMVTATQSTAEVFKAPWVWIMIAIWFLQACGTYGILYWLPLLIKAATTQASVLAVGLISALPYLSASLSMTSIARLADRSKSWILFLIGTCAVGATGFLVVAILGFLHITNLWLSILCLTVASSGLWSMHGPFWSIPAGLLTGEVAATSYAIINSAASLGGFFGPFLIGTLTDRTGTFNAALLFIGTLIVLAVLFTLQLRVMLPKKHAFDGQNRDTVPLYLVVDDE